MASAWADGLPKVKMAQGRTPKAITAVYPYYDNADFLARQIEWWRCYPAHLSEWLRVTVVDDGSPQAPAARVVGMLRSQFVTSDATGEVIRRVPSFVRLFQIGVDVPWNWLAARNIGAHHASDGWLLLTDIDHVVPEETLRSLIYGQHDPAVVYVFSRREHTGEPVQPHSASFFMTREMFWTIGGYDEELSGRYGTDGDFRRRIKAVAPIRVLTDELVRYEYVGDSSTTRYARKLPEDAAAVKRIVASRSAGWTPRTLSFPYQEVTC